MGNRPSAGGIGNLLAASRMDFPYKKAVQILYLNVQGKISQGVDTRLAGIFTIYIVGYTQNG
jgi:hypothetical protein